MEIRNIVTFIRVAELNSFTKAATQLGYSQAAVTVQIKQLEQEIGTRLFDRVGKTVKLTVSGEKFMPYAMAVIKACDDATNFVKNEQGISGVLKIGASSSFSASIMPNVFKEFNAIYPNVRIVVNTTDIVDSMYDQLRQNEIDIMFILEKKGIYDDCITYLEVPEEIVLVTNVGNPLAKEENVTLEDLLDRPFISSTSEASYCYYFERLLAEKELSLEPVMEIGSTTAILNILKDGEGVAILPRFVAEGPAKAGELEIVESFKVDIEMMTQMLCFKNKWINPQMKAFIDFLQENYADIRSV